MFAKSLARSFVACVVSALACTVLAQAPPLPSEQDIGGLLDLYDVPGASLAFVSGCEEVAGCFGD